MVGRHCPFLNRNDARCARHFTVNRLQHAFTRCFDAYDGCPSYRELLAGRTADRAARATMLTIGGRHLPNHTNAGPGPRAQASAAH